MKIRTKGTGISINTPVCPIDKKDLKKYLCDGNDATTFYDYAAIYTDRYDATNTVSYALMRKQMFMKRIKKVIFADPATIIYWSDGDKTVVKCGENDKFDPEKGLAMAIAKKFFDNSGFYYDIFKKWLPKEEDKDGSKD